MSGVEVKVPTLGESVTEAVIVRWIKSDGESVEVDEPLLELETEKASVEIPAEAAGVLRVLKNEGETVNVGDVVAEIAVSSAAAAKPSPAAAEARSETRAASPLASVTPMESARAKQPPRRQTEGQELSRMTSLARRVADEHEVDVAAIEGSGRGGRITKGDVLARLGTAEPQGDESPPAPVPGPRRAAAEPGADEERVPMSPIRRRIAERLLEAQHSAAILTTFNEIDMSAVIDLRRRYKERFAEVHGVPLGFMSFFARSCVSALAEVAVLNAELRDSDIVYKKRVHLGIAVASPRGLVVPVVRDAHHLSFGELETEIGRLAARAREGKLSVDELTGGSFSITNGGVFGSLLSTPILNPPQPGILGMHKIEPRPVVVEGAVVVRPMMYVALSYDHRIVDGQQAVTFLVRVKERIEDPSRLMLEV